MSDTSSRTPARPRVPEVLPVGDRRKPLPPLDVIPVPDEPPLLDVLPAREGPAGPPPASVAAPERHAPAGFWDYLGWTFRGLGSAAEWVFGAGCLVVGLAVLAAVPVLQLLSLGYQLE